mgnify:CR=1 FL=1
MRGILIAVLVLVAGALAAADDDEWVRPYEPYLPGTEPLDDEGDKLVVAVRVLRRSIDQIRPHVLHALLETLARDYPVDPDRIHRVLVNLLRNAVQASPGGFLTMLSHRSTIALAG